ncbi:MAG: DNA translocase FtsK [Bacilli bacterium]|nr:DNA translocase FtsK [Bacilli bacterium]
MSLFELIYISRYRKIIRKIDSLNKKNIQGYQTFKEYILADELIIPLYCALKKIEKKYPRLHVDSYETFQENLYNQINRVYDKMVTQIYEVKNDYQRKQKLVDLENNINDSFGHGCDDIIQKLLIDLKYKITNINKFRIKEITICDEEPIIEDVIKFIVEVGKVSASLLQRRFRLGYNRAAHIVDILEKKGYIGGANGSEPREVLITIDNSKNSTIRTTLEEISDEEYNEILLSNRRKNKSIKEIMKEYNVEIDYNQMDVFLKLENSLILKSNNDIDKNDVVNNVLKYMSPEKMKIVLINNNILTFNNYNGIPHLLFPIVNDIDNEIIVLQEIVFEMDHRYDLFVKEQIKSYEKYKKMNLPYILIVIDEISLMINNRDIRTLLTKILLNGTRAGIKLLMFSKFNEKNLNLGPIENLVRIHEIYNLDNILNRDNIIYKSLGYVENNSKNFDFEKYAVIILESNGFNSIELTKSNRNSVVTIIAYKNDIKYAIQCNNYSTPVGLKAVQEAIESKINNDCHVATILTNNIFTKGAVKLANKNNVLLWDKEKLQKLIYNTRNSK